MIIILTLIPCFVMGAGTYILTATAYTTEGVVVLSAGIICYYISFLIDETVRVGRKLDFMRLK